jgi:anti-sigma-K factor RskA
MRRTGAGLHTLVGAYVMDAVPAADRAAFERHLTRCALCRDEVRELRETTAHLAAATAIEPRPELRAATLAAAARLRQMPPQVLQPQPARFSWRARIVVVTAVIAVAAAVALGVRLGSMQHQLSAAQQRDHAIAAVLGAPDAITVTEKVTTGGTATVVMSPHAKMLVITCNRLSALPRSKAYELWLMGPAGDRPAGMLSPARHGMTGPMVVGGLQHRDMLGLTIEPAAGSGQPTTEPIVMVGLGH